jgi:hypothetical protein
MTLLAPLQFETTAHCEQGEHPMTKQHEDKNTTAQKAAPVASWRAGGLEIAVWQNQASDE